MWIKKHLFIFLLLLFSLPCWGATIYVATTGNDDTGDGSISTPYATFTHAYSVASNGDTISVGDGTYTLTENFNLDGATGISFVETDDAVYVNGNVSYHFRIYADGTKITGFEFLTGSSDYHNIVLIGADNCEITNCVLLDSITISNSDNCLFEGNQITNENSGNGTACFWVINGSDGNIIRNNRCLESSYWGIEIGGAGGGSTVNCDGNLVEGNFVQNASRHGINVYRSKNNIIRNNEVTGSTLFGLHDDQCSTTYLGTGVYANNYWYNNKSYLNGIGQTVSGHGMTIEGSEGVYVYNNTFSQNGTNGIYISEDPNDLNPSHIYLSNNIFDQNGDDGVGVFVYQVLVQNIAVLAECNNNDIYDGGVTAPLKDRDADTWYTVETLNALSIASDNIDDDPQLTDNYSIVTGSPCIDAGTDVGVYTDYRGLHRPQGSAVDIGAYEAGNAIQFEGVTLEGVTIE